MLAFISYCCKKRIERKCDLLTVEDIVFAMEHLSKDDFKKLLKYYIKSRSQRDEEERQTHTNTNTKQARARSS